MDEETQARQDEWVLMEHIRQGLLNAWSKDFTSREFAVHEPRLVFDLDRGKPCIEIGFRGSSHRLYAERDQ